MDITGLFPAFGGVALTLAAFVIALSVIVAIHEYGHYIVGRWCGIHAEVFSLGFGPVLVSRRDRRGTLWQFALLPFGGYVKFKGDANAASGPEEGALDTMSAEEARSTMQGAPLWARSATVAAGPFFNFIFSILVFALVFFGRGEVSEPLSIGEMEPLPVSHALQSGDEIVAIAGIDVPAFSDEGAFDTFVDDIPLRPLLEYTVRRDGQRMEVEGPYPYPAIVRQLAPQSAAFAINMKVGDVIVGVDGTPVFAFSQLKDAVEGSNGRVLELDVWRDGEVLDFSLAPRRVDEPQPEGGFETQWRIGIAGGLFFEPETTTPGPFSALWSGVTQTVRIVESSLSGLYYMVTGAISSCNLSGPIGIAEASGTMASQGAESFIWFIAVLSTAVGLLNLFPIPVLDGGHLVFYGYEAVSGRPPSDRALRILMGTGLALILSLMVFALTNDIFCP